MTPKQIEYIKWRIAEGGLPPNDMACLRALWEQHESLAAENARLSSLNKRWNLSAAECGYAGSEYIDDPDRVFDRVKETQRVQMKCLVAERAKHERSQQVLQQVDDFLNSRADWDECSRIVRLVGAALRGAE